jgi:2-polyprenyl-6-methoxyphenol hydroxylase-like FAD-dependent oxidoreductase
MALGIDLALRGVSIVVCEARALGETFHARTNLTNARSMQHFRRWGMADALRANDPIPAAVDRDVRFVTRGNGRILLNFAGGLEWDERMPITPEQPEWAPSQAIERTLRERLLALAPDAIVWDATVTDFKQDEDGAEAIWTDANGDEHSITGKYVIIADGATSRLRKKLNISLTGETIGYNAAWHIHAPELVDHLDVKASSMIWFYNEDGYCDTLVPQSAEGHWMYSSAPLPAGVDAEDWEAIRGMIYRSVGSEFPVEPVRGGTWLSHSRMAPRYDFGRAFLVGDAAHLTSSMGGFGMNMGIGDAADLGWKLAATLQGWGGPRLLETYTIERQEAERFIIDGSAAIEAVAPRSLSRPHMEEDSERGERARAEVVDLILTEKTREFYSMGAQLGYRYEASPIIMRERGESPPLDYGNYTPCARPGHLAPHVWLDTSTSLYDLFGAGFTLLRLDGTADVSGFERAAAEATLPLEIVDLDSDEARELYQTRLVLIRPDQHIAWRGDDAPQDCALVLDTVRGSLATRYASPATRAPVAG